MTELDTSGLQHYAARDRSAPPTKRVSIWVWIVIGLGVVSAGYAAFSFVRGFNNVRSHGLEQQQQHCLEGCLPKCENAKKAGTRASCTEACEDLCAP